MHDHPDFPSVIGGGCIHFTQQNLVHRMAPSSSGGSLSRERSSCVTERGSKPALNAKIKYSTSITFK